MTRKEKIKLLELRDALIIKDIDEAYHILYSLADPDFNKINPWHEWEEIKNQDRIIR